MLMKFFITIKNSIMLE